MTKFILIFLRLLPAEFAHSITIFVLMYFPFFAPKLKIVGLKSVKIFNKMAKNCLGIAAGFDKNAQCISGLFRMGFGVVEVGTVTLNPQAGNVKPRIFRLKNDRSIINKMGFPSLGADFVRKKVMQYKRRSGEILGVNIGKNKNGSDADYVTLIQMFDGICDYITINISSPNTVGLRDILEAENFEKFAAMISEVGAKIPLMLKISPDSKNITQICLIAKNYGFSGIIVSNTTVSRAGLDARWQDISGGLSGKMLQEKSVKAFDEVVQNTNDMIIFAAGGIENLNDVQKRISGGASIVQVYTGLVYGSFL